MQQGVMETPLYNGFMLKSSMEEKERTLNTQVSRAYEKGNSKTKRDLLWAHQRMQVGVAFQLGRAQAQECNRQAEESPAGGGGKKQCYHHNESHAFVVGRVS